MSTRPVMVQSLPPQHNAAASITVTCCHRHLQQDTETTGTVGPACDVGPTCLSLNVSCKADATAAIIAAGGTVPSSRISLTGNTNPGCLLLPTAAGNVSLTGILGLNMNQMYQLTMVTEDTLFPVPNRYVA